MDKAKSSLTNMEYGIFPKASDHESAAEIGWLLYSTRMQDEERLSDLLSKLTNEKIGAKWRPIWTTDYSKKKEPEDPAARTYAIHLECASNKVIALRQQLSKWYGSKSRDFPDGTKMRLVPPFQTIISFSCKGKYSSLVAHQAALSSRLGTCNTWEFTTNLILDRPEPATGITLRQIIMSIPSQSFPNTPLFHTVDMMWRSDNGVTFGFLPENAADAHSFCAGLIPFLRETASPWFLRAFTEEAKVNHAANKWDPKTRQIFSADEVEVEEYLAEDDEMNKTDEPTLAKPKKNQDEYVKVNVPRVAEHESFPTMYNDNDSVSTFNPSTPTTVPTSHQPSSVFTPKIISHAHSSNNHTNAQPSLPMEVDEQDNAE
jgi:hypothetical protein